MKTYLTILAIFLMLGANAQSVGWQAVGPDDFEQISSPGAKSPHVYVDTSGGVYLFYAEILQAYGTVQPYLTNYKYVLKKETPSGWLTLTTVQNTSYTHAFGMNKKGELFFTRETKINGQQLLLTEKFDGVSWSNAGQPYLLNFLSAPYCKMQFDKNDNPSILFSAYGNSVLPEMISWNGTNWNSIGGPIATTVYGKFLYDFDSSNQPHVIYFDALNNQVQIKKFNGTSWIINNIPSAVINTNYQSNHLKADFRIYRDTMYLSYGKDGYATSMSAYPPTLSIMKFNGTNWVTLASNGLGPITSSVPAPLFFYFDSSKNSIYLMGGESYNAPTNIYKLVGNSLQTTGMSGDLTIRNDTFFTIDNPISNGMKIRFVKIFNSYRIEEYPVTIASFNGGGISANAALGNVYWIAPNHSFFLDDSALLNLNAVKYVNNTWRIFRTGISVDDKYPKFYRDSGSYPYLLKPSSVPSLSLFKISQDTAQKIGGDIINSYFSYGSCAFDINNVPHVAFVDITQFGGRRVRVKKFDGVNWLDLSSVNPFASTGVSANPLLFVNPANQINVVYKQGADILISAFNGSNWNVVSPSYGPVMDSAFQIVVNNAGQPYISFLQSFKKPVVVRFNGSSWDTVGIPGFSQDAVTDLKIYINNDTPFVAYSDKHFGKVIVAKYNGSVFGALGTLDISRDTSCFPNLVFQGNDVYVSYWSQGIFVKKNTNDTLLPLSLCVVPSVKIAGVNDTAANASWAIPTPALGYEYVLSTSTQLPSSSGTFTKTLSYSDSSLQPGTTYYFFVRTICGLDTSAWVMQSFTTTNTTGISNTVAGEYDVSVYPNPVSGLLHIEQLTAAQPQQFELYDIFGRKVRTISFSSKSVQVDISDLPAGVYSLRGISGKNPNALKIVKQ
ncbi:MAG TPA: T9SS type A sorting domain-containing protein [Flavipsychrobacter sp.]|nr:T9SS type A sorting domain-containing protein [Flavipsychrobacter sp.]